MKKLQAANKDATERFDETLTKLFQKKVRCEMATYQVSQNTQNVTQEALSCPSHNYEKWHLNNIQFHFFFDVIYRRNSRLLILLIPSL